MTSVDNDEPRAASRAAFVEKVAALGAVADAQARGDFARVFGVPGAAEVQNVPNDKESNA